MENNILNGNDKPWNKNNEEWETNILPYQETIYGREYICKECGGKKINIFTNFCPNCGVKIIR